MSRRQFFELAGSISIFTITDKFVVPVSGDFQRRSILRCCIAAVELEDHSKIRARPKKSGIPVVKQRDMSLE